MLTDNAEGNSSSMSLRALRKVSVTPFSHFVISSGRRLITKERFPGFAASPSTIHPGWDATKRDTDRVIRLTAAQAKFSPFRPPGACPLRWNRLIAPALSKMMAISTKPILPNR